MVQQNNQSGMTATVGQSRINIGRFTYGHENLQIQQWDEGASLTIGSFCSISTKIIVMLGGNHRIDWITTYPFGHVYASELGGESIKGHPATKGDIVIGNDVWIARGATLMSGITVGDGAVIGTNAVVVGNVGAYEIVGGNPARHIKHRFAPEIIDLLLQLKWWELPVPAIREITHALSAPPTAEGLRQLIARYRGGKAA